ncbi:Crp/Fnr family transcriptional regulator [Alteromonadaceae bacterium M269]|nr:Crp/Fnr family transcriptional regulator [Alteromonadaceae bacterium M269]
MATKDQIKQLLSNNDWFRELPPDVIEKLATLCRIKTLSSGELLFEKGDQPKGLYCVLTGKMRVSSITTEGKEALLTWLEPGQWFGEISLFDGLPRTHDSHAETETTLLLLPSQGFSGLLSNHPELYQHFVTLLCQKLRQTFSLLEDSASLSNKGQLARRLILLSHNPMLANSRSSQDDDATHTRISVSQESLASMLNITRQTVNKLLQELQQLGMIKLHYGCIDIIDTDALETLTVK